MMAEPREVLVPDIGDFADVPVIEILVKPGDEVGADAPLVTLESEKATMDVPSPFAGKIVELKVDVGDTVSEGSVIALIEPAEAGAISTQEAPVESAIVAEEQESDGTEERASRRPRTTLRQPGAPSSDPRRRIRRGPSPHPTLGRDLCQPRSEAARA